MKRLPRQYAGKVNGPVLVELIKAARVVTCRVDVGDDNSYGHLDGVMVVRSDLLKELDYAEEAVDDIFWVCWRGGPGRVLSIDPGMDRESNRTWPEKVWTNIDEPPPIKEKV